MSTKSDWLVKVTNKASARDNKGKIALKESMLDARRVCEHDIGSAIRMLVEKHQKLAQKVNNQIEIHTYNPSGVRVGWNLVLPV